MSADIYIYRLMNTYSSQVRTLAPGIACPLPSPLLPTLPHPGTDRSQAFTNQSTGDLKFIL